MNKMNEYISKDKIIQDIEEEIGISNMALDEDVWFNRGLKTALNYIKNTPTADVQPVNQWISVKDRFPDDDGWYLVYKFKQVRIAEWCENCWYNERDLPIDDVAITHWMPLPEPPKDGDAK